MNPHEVERTALSITLRVFQWRSVEMIEVVSKCGPGIELRWEAGDSSRVAARAARWPEGKPTRQTSELRK
jgi:hypothetical protein